LIVFAMALAFMPCTSFWYLWHRNCSDWSETITQCSWFSKEIFWHIQGCKFTKCQRSTCKYQQQELLAMVLYMGKLHLTTASQVATSFLLLPTTQSTFWCATTFSPVEHLILYHTEFNLFIEK
jgi:hypothetical protein